MNAYPNLEIGLHRRNADYYSIELHFSRPESDADVRLARREPSLAQFDQGRLREFLLDPDAYGQELGQNLLVDPAVRTLFDQARSAAQILDFFRLPKDGRYFCFAFQKWHNL